MMNIFLLAVHRFTNLLISPLVSIISLMHASDHLTSRNLQAVKGVSHK